MRTPASRPVGAVAVAEALATLRARLMLIAVLCVLGGLAGFLAGQSDDAESTTQVRVGIFPLAENATVVDLGVSTPVGPIAANFYSQAVLDPISEDMGAGYDDLRLALHIDDVPNDPHQLILRADQLDDISSEDLVTAWTDSILANRQEALDKALAGAQRGLERELEKDLTSRERKDTERNLVRFAALTNSVSSDVTVLRAAQEVDGVSTAKSPAVTTAAGLIAGLVGGVALALALAVVDGKIRTRPALTARFGLPVAASLPPGRIVVIEAGPPGSGEDAKAAIASGSQGEVAVAGRAGEGDWQADAGRADGVVVAVRPGRTTTDQAAALEVELSILPEPVKLVGLVVV